MGLPRKYFRGQIQHRQELIRYYKDLLTNPFHDQQQSIDKITRNIPRILTQEHNEALMRPINVEEVELVVKDMALARPWVLMGLPHIYSISASLLSRMRSRG